MRDYVERLISTIKIEAVNLADDEYYQDPLRQLGQFLDVVYRHNRIHSIARVSQADEFEVTWCAWPAVASNIRKIGDLTV